MNLRLDPRATDALRAEALRSGLSQQVILRRAVDEYLGLSGPPRPTYPDWVIAPDGAAAGTGPVLPDIPMPPGVTVLDLLEREDRI